jgi:hypothetical protein
MRKGLETGPLSHGCTRGYMRPDPTHYGNVGYYAQTRVSAYNFKCYQALRPHEGPDMVERTRL